MDASMTPLLCINCNIRINTTRRHQVLQLDERASTLIANRVSPIIVTEEDYICNACWSLTMQAVNNQLHGDSGFDQSAGASLRGHRNVCITCGFSLLTRQSDRVMRENPSRLILQMVEIIENKIAPHQISSSDRVCHACWLKAKRAALRSQQNIAMPETRERSPIRPEESIPMGESSPIRTEVSNPIEETSPILTEESIPAQDLHGIQHGTQQGVAIPGYKRAANTASHCLFSGCNNLRPLHTMSDSLRATVLSNYNFYIPKLARVCSEHLYANSWNTLYEAENAINNFEVEQIRHVFSFVNAFKSFLDFSNIESVNQMDEHLFGYWMGMSKDNFILMLYELPRVMEKHRGILGLAAVLVKMRTGDSDERLSTIFQVPRRTLERLMHSVIEILLQDFVPRNLGINNLPRSQLIEHNLRIPNAIYNQNQSQVIVMCDGTYIYLNKSSNYMFQKDSYSLHKYRNLLKPFLIVACDGYIVDCLGPYKATTSDAEIMVSLFSEENSPLRQYFQDNDIFILDRGFRDSIGLLESCNYKAYMPESLLEGEHQLTTSQANRSRCVTICRWVVEVVNGYFKRDYRLLRFDHFNRTLPNMMAYFQIAASLINKFGVRLRDRDDAVQIINILRERMPLQNNLSRVVNELNLNRRASFFRSITANDNNILFPRLEYDELILFALGTYQLRQAKSYYGEHVRFHGGYRIEVCTQNINAVELGLRGSGDNLLIKGKIKSRHITRRQYYVYILIENNLNGREGIKEYCCNCIVGRRTVGCCAHVMTMVWYLGWARFQSNIAAPAEFLDHIVVREDDE